MMYRIKKQALNIEFIFLSWILLNILFIVSLAIIQIVQGIKYGGPSHRKGMYDEGTPLALFAVIVFIVYNSLFLVWQHRLWRKFLTTAERKYGQMIFIFVFGILPFALYFLMLLSILFLRIYRSG